MRKKFLKGIISRCEKKFTQPYDKIIAELWGYSMDLYFEADAIEDQAQAHGEGRLQTKMLTAYCGACYNIERYQQIEVVDGVLSCSKCNSDIIVGANNIVYHGTQTDRFTAYNEQHSKGFISIENLVRVVDNLKTEADLGIQISVDGRVWICVDGIAFLRFKPKEGGEQ